MASWSAPLLQLFSSYAVARHLVSSIGMLDSHAAIALLTPFLMPSDWHILVPHTCAVSLQAILATTCFMKCYAASEQRATKLRSIES